MMVFCWQAFEKTTREKEEKDKRKVEREMKRKIQAEELAIKPRKQRRKQRSQLNKLF